MSISVIHQDEYHNLKRRKLENVLDSSSACTRPQELIHKTSPRSPLISFPKHFRLKTLLGSGSYGKVYKCVDTHTGKTYAVKRIDDVFSDSEMAKSIYREIVMLKTLGNNPGCKHIVNLRGVVCTQSNQTAKSYSSIALIMDYNSMHLGEYMHSQMYQGTWSSIKYIFSQLVKAVAHVHAHGAIHRDIKPSNIMIDPSTQHVTLIDFNSARILKTSDSKKAPVLLRRLSQHVVTRWYRPPEILLMSRTYDQSVDIWSLGLIFAELLQCLSSCPLAKSEQRPLFDGTWSSFLSEKEKKLDDTSYEQLRLIVDVLDISVNPKDHDWVNSTLFSHFLSRSETPKNQPRPSIQAFFSWVTDLEAMNLLHAMLAFNPDKRPSAADILNHPFLADGAESKQDSYTLSTFPSDYHSFESRCNSQMYSHTAFQNIFDMEINDSLFCSQYSQHIQTVLPETLEYFDQSNIDALRRNISNEFFLHV